MGTCPETLKKRQNKHFFKVKRTLFQSQKNTFSKSKEHLFKVKRTTYLSNLYRNIEKASKEPPFCQTCPETLKNVKRTTFLSNLCRNIEKTSKEPPFCQTVAETSR